MDKQPFDTESYRHHMFFKRNQEIWKYRFIENWSLKKLSKHFDLKEEEIKEILVIHGEFYRREYN